MGGAANACDFDYRGFTFLFDDADRDAGHVPRVITAHGVAKRACLRSPSSAMSSGARVGSIPASEMVDRLDQGAALSVRLPDETRTVSPRPSHDGAVGQLPPRDSRSLDMGARRLRWTALSTVSVRNSYRSQPLSVATPNLTPLSEIHDLPSMHPLTASDLRPLRALAEKAESKLGWPATRPVRRVLLEILRRRAFRDLGRLLRRSGPGPRIGGPYADWNRCWST